MPEEQEQTTQQSEQKDSQVQPEIKVGGLQPIVVDIVAEIDVNVEP